MAQGTRGIIRYLRMAARQSIDVSRRAPWLTDASREGLEAAFAVDPKPSLAVRQDLAMKSGASVQKISQWFINRRAKAQVRMERAKSSAPGRELPSEVDAGGGDAGADAGQELRPPRRRQSGPTSPPRL